MPTYSPTSNYIQAPPRIKEFDDLEDDDQKEMLAIVETSASWQLTFHANHTVSSTIRMQSPELMIIISQLN